MYVYTYIYIYTRSKGTIAYQVNKETPHLKLKWPQFNNLPVNCCPTETIEIEFYIVLKAQKMSYCV